MKNKISGITLIALVITIIVLLILAGVSIAMLTGENGILTQVQKAKLENTKSMLKEQIELAVLNARLNDSLDGSINLSALEEGINAIDGVTEIKKQGSNENLPWNVTVSDFKFQIAENGRVEAINGIALSKTQVRMVAGETETITATIMEGTIETITWSSSNTNVVTVSGGAITAVAESGTAIITASITSGGVTYEATCTVTIVSKVTAISAEDLMILEGSTKQINVTTTPISNVEDLSYESSNLDVVTVDANGNVTAKNLSSDQTTATAIITIKGIISGVTGTCNVTVQATKKIEVGDFVKYDVSYTDVYDSSYHYTNMNGWRIQSYDDNKDGTYSNVKLISTGIPAKLYYSYDDSTYSSWYVRDSTQLTEFKTILGSGYLFYNSTATYYSLMAAAGMYYNFGDIVFRYGTTYTNKSQGYFTSITKGDITYNSANGVDTNGNELFKTGNANSVRLLTVSEINKAFGISDVDSMSTIGETADSKGLYRLDQLQNITGMSNYIYSTENYLLASPYPVSNGVSSIVGVSSDGTKKASGHLIEAGVRPVISIDPNVSFELSKDGTYFTMK